MPRRWLAVGAADPYQGPVFHRGFPLLSQSLAAVMLHFRVKIIVDQVQVAFWRNVGPGFPPACPRDVLGSRRIGVSMMSHGVGQALPPLTYLVCHSLAPASPSLEIQYRGTAWGTEMSPGASRAGAAVAVAVSTLRLFKVRPDIPNGQWRTSIGQYARHVPATDEPLLRVPDLVPGFRQKKN